MSLLFLCLIISMTIFFLTFFFDLKKNFNLNKSSLFECGFDSISHPRSPFSIYFFKLCLIFIIFDIEIIIILPSPIIFINTVNFLFIFSFLMIIFFISLIFEWNQNSLNWMK